MTTIDLGTTPDARVREAARLAREAEQQLDRAVAEARRERVTWETIAACVGYRSRGAARTRFARVVDAEQEAHAIA